MTFELIENSIDLGKPIRLYKFQRGVVSWCYCSADRDITYQSQKFKAVVGGISDSGILQSGEVGADAFEITAPMLDVAQLYRNVGPSSAVEVTVYEIHYGDAEAIIRYMGEIVSVKFPQVDRCVVVCNAGSLEQTGLRFTWGPGCNYQWADHNCGVDREFYKVESFIQTMDGLTISNGEFASFDDGYFAGGEIEWPVGQGLFDRRGIVAHVGSTLELLGGTSGLTPNTSIVVFPSCDKTFESCGFYNNQENYGGAPDSPDKSPFDGDPIF
ncbi:MAG TPA: phage BR0599 family protein [Cellvibrio sp.]|nr:phage BR0599 family protein [Cellvibrio sp.]